MKGSSWFEWSQLQPASIKTVIMLLWRDGGEERGERKRLRQLIFHHIKAWYSWGKQRLTRMYDPSGTRGGGKKSRVNHSDLLDMLYLICLILTKIVSKQHAYHLHKHTYLSASLFLGRCSDFHGSWRHCEVARQLAESPGSQCAQARKLKPQVVVFILWF